MHPADRWNEEEWAELDAALRGHTLPGPDQALRARCLPAVGGTTPESLRVLVVDDEPNLRKLVELHLARAGYAVRTAASGEEALELLPEWSPALMVLDVMMPGLNGFEVLAQVKADPATAEVLVVMLTARGEDDSVRRGWKRGADFYMPKPFNPEELKMVVDRLTRPLGTPENPPPLRRWSK